MGNYDVKHEQFRSGLYQ